jgi:hypothetical protein
MPKRDGYESEDSIDAPAQQRPLPDVGAKIAINCPADPPHPAGWYSAVVVGGVKKGKNQVVLTIEWDGGDVDELHNPDWRYLGEEPDQKGNTSGRDARLRPHLAHVVRRLICTDRAESRLPMATRRMKKGVTDLEWVQCKSQSCGKWRAMPPFIQGGALLRSCNNQFYCVLNYWDESLASCAAPQETRLMEVNSDIAASNHSNHSNHANAASNYQAAAAQAPPKPVREVKRPENDYEYGYKPPQKRRR